MDKTKRNFKRKTKQLFVSYDNLLPWMGEAIVITETKDGGIRPNSNTGTHEI